MSLIQVRNLQIGELTIRSFDPDLKLMGVNSLNLEPLGLLFMKNLNLKPNSMVLIKTRGVALPFTLKSILRQKKNYGNSNISPCKSPLQETKIIQDIIAL
jgi:hypothetical protein